MSPHLRAEFLEYVGATLNGYDQAQLFCKGSRDKTDVLVELVLEEIDKDLFRPQMFTKPMPTLRAVFGGQLLAQAMVAARRSVENKEMVFHSVHSYFLVPGDPSSRAVYAVTRVRDGRSFCTRQVVCKQEGRPIFTLMASFHKPEVTRLSHHRKMPDVPSPEACVSRPEFLKENIVKAKAAGNLKLVDNLEKGLEIFHKLGSPIEMRYVNPPDSAWYQWWRREAEPPISQFWFRYKGELPDTLDVHHALAAYLSDNGMVVCCRKAVPHPHNAHSLVGTLDHSMWFHGPMRVDEWLFYDIELVRAISSRCFLRGYLYTEQGELVATCAQELILRLDEKTNAALAKRQGIPFQPLPKL